MHQRAVPAKGRKIVTPVALDGIIGMGFNPSLRPLSFSSLFLSVPYDGPLLLSVSISAACYCQRCSNTTGRSTLSAESCSTMKLSAAGAALIITGATAGAMVPGPDQGKPNFVFILSDDQDAELYSVAYMPRLRQHLAARGTTFNSHYVTTAVCCPSRVSLWTGRQPHNTNVTDVKPPWGMSICVWNGGG